MSDSLAAPNLFDPNFTFDAHSSLATHEREDDLDPLATMSDDSNKNEEGKRMVPFTVASVLPKCDYKEEWEPKERRTDAYNAVQIQILEYLDTHAADQLSVAQAHSFIENAGTKPHGPTAKQAVELCYFMRSHGFDVYTKLAPQEHKIRLYIADRNAMNRNRDKLFWEQCTQTNESVAQTELATVPAPPAPIRARRGRRGAVPDITTFPNMSLAEDSSDE